jgi:hypothetical protein
MPIALTPVALPDFGLPTDEPTLSPAIYTDRLTRLYARMQQAGLDTLLVYADREHTANLTYLCGYDPRFEEALLILRPETADMPPALLVGNEGWGYTELCPSPIRRVLYQPLSLLGQSRAESPRLDVILRAEGITAGSRVGLAGWKYFSGLEFDEPQFVSEIPSYIVETVRVIVGPTTRPVNANALLMNPANGLRIINEAEQLAVFEYAACHSSGGLRNVLFGMQPGMTEHEAATLMRVNGLPLAAHLMLTNGPRARYGLPSPSMNKLTVGQPFTMCLSYWGALTARAGWLVRDVTELPDGVEDYLEKLAIPYFRAIVAWYEAIGIGTTGGELYDIIHQHIGDPFFGVSLNPGHFIHIDEWVHSPIFAGSDLTIQSGMAMQVDVIPATGTAYHTINIEDGIAIADGLLRREISQKYPAMWARIEARRRFMADIIGIRLKPEVLPFSNIPAYLPPYLLSPGQALTVKY